MPLLSASLAVLVGAFSLPMLQDHSLRDLRARALTMPPSDIGLSRKSYAHNAWAIVLDVGLDHGKGYTLLVLGDGTTSLYFSTGGGIIGAGEHRSVRIASAALLTEADGHIATLRPATTSRLPEEGVVRFHIRTFDGNYGYEAREGPLARGDDAHAALFAKAQLVIAEIRRHSRP